MFVAEAPSTGSDPPDRSLVRTPGSTDVEEMPLPEVEREICELAAHIAAATCRWLTLAAEFDRRSGHERFGFVSCASWLAWRCSITPRAAREQLRVARSLRDLPGIRAAFARGALSYSKVRALTRVAEPEMEAELLALAEDATAAQLERLLRGYRGAIAADTAERTRSRRHLATRWEDDGSLTIRASLPPEEGALFLQGLGCAGHELRGEAAGDHGRGSPEPPESGSGAGAEDPLHPRRRQSDRQPDRADALVALAESAIARGVAASPGGERNRVVVHIDLGALVSADDTAAATLGEGVALPAETARRLGCDAAIVTMIERDGEPLSVGRRTRSIPPALRRALQARDRCCRYPGCDHDRFVDAHHIEHWAHGGATSLGNLVLLCRRHHRLLHEGGFTLAVERGELTFRTPDGQVVHPVPAASIGSVAGCARSGHAGIDAEAISPGCRGERIDYDLAVLALAERRERRAGSPQPA